MISNVIFKTSLRAGFRWFSTSQEIRFKFKLTEEICKEFEEKQAQLKKEEPELAVHTRESSLIMGKVSNQRYKNVVKCSVPKHRLNEYILMHVRENDNVQAIDDNNITDPGDWVLLRRDESIPDDNVKHRIEKVVYKYGSFVDPTTKKRSLGLYYDDDWKRLEQIKIEI